MCRHSPGGSAADTLSIRWAEVVGVKSLQMIDGGENRSAVMARSIVRGYGRLYGERMEVSYQRLHHRRWRRSSPSRQLRRPAKHEAFAFADQGVFLEEPQTSPHACVLSCFVRGCYSSPLSMPQSGQDYCAPLPRRGKHFLKTRLPASGRPGLGIVQTPDRAD